MAAPPPGPPKRPGRSSSPTETGDPSTVETSYSTINTPATMTSHFPSGQQTLYTSSLPTSVAAGYGAAGAIPTYKSKGDKGDKGDKGSKGDKDDGTWDHLDTGARAGVGIAIAIGVLIIVMISVWFCCGCCGLRKRRKERREGLRAPDTITQSPLPLNTVTPGSVPPKASDAPPEYEEAVPPRHQHIAGGARHGIEEEEQPGVISDGKTPLSEIPFEDVVLDHSPSEGSSRSFNERHHGIGGDTRGHTNT
ncbi:uncharacterized protein RSE6_04254 [Rhynchosporium secalis]|uniref:Uncharacterized protein n=1 Tax=Rhynchosporium secalis TaxID=38038 RepID=A0A1E1M4U7_RHYSE|nr:uncharacterized protein RSE6_04254 [Rhynchosporium secalis]